MAHAIRTRSLAFALLILAGMVPFLGQAAWAQDEAAPAGQADVSYATLADLLEDDAARERLITQLRGMAEEPADETATADEAAADTPAAIPAEKVSLPRRVARTTQALAEDLGTQVSAAMAAFRDNQSSRAAIDWRALGQSAFSLAVIIVITVALFLVLRLLAHPFYARAGRWAQTTETGLSALIQRGSIMVLSLGVDILVILAACAGGYAAALFAFGEAGAIGTRESLFINAFALIEIFKALIRALFSSRYEGLRPLPIDSHVADWWSLRLRWFSGYIGYALMLVVPIVNVELSRAMGSVVGLIVMGTAYLYAIGVIVKNRDLIRQRLENQAVTSDGAVAGILLRIASKSWHVIALAYFTILFVVSQLRPEEALPFMLKATLQTLVAAGVGMVVLSAMSRLIGRRLHLAGRIRDRLPLLEDRLNAYVPNVLRVARVLVLITVTLLLLDAWRVFNLAQWLASDAGAHAIAMVVHVAIILLLALAFWTVCASVIEAKLASGEASARKSTLLTLFRNALAVVIVTFTAMIVLSQIGVNIGPLIAGAGVLGLAIGFGAQTMVQDVITGVFIQIENAMNKGDVVTAGGVTGTAERLSIRSVAIRDLSGTYHIVPFSSVGVVSNYMRDFAYHVGEYGIAYRENIDDAIVALRAAFEDLKADPTHGVNVIDDINVAGVIALADSSVNIRVMIKTNPGSQWAVGRAYNRLVKIHFDAAGIEIPFPHLTMYFGEDRQGHAPPANLRLVGNGGGGNVIEDHGGPDGAPDADNSRPDQRARTNAPTDRDFDEADS
ncbi:mechanosensitive channel protein [Salinisphaera sp. W335]|uniref:Mechanosensitive channel protein n=2 Tax=Spectribacter hydrogenoxidans TaxID=3075608 RepID=A0ABU3C1Y5_9GAMM|nr:mechanosensitive channel protein [Salinisphaera sp. W335]MDT0635564.1 mechanosensitive channel protein [Salinisphaera sp. W335]